MLKKKSILISQPIKIMCELWHTLSLSIHIYTSMIMKALQMCCWVSINLAKGKATFVTQIKGDSFNITITSRQFSLVNFTYNWIDITKKCIQKRHAVSLREAAVTIVRIAIYTVCLNNKIIFFFAKIKQQMTLLTCKQKNDILLFSTFVLKIKILLDT